MKHPLLALVTAVALAACRGAQAPPPDQPSTATGAPGHLSKEMLSFLEFGKVGELPAPAVRELPATVDFDEEHTARLSALVPGRVAELLAQVGDTVAEGQPLVAIDSAEVKAAQADLVKEASDLVVAKRAAERAQRLQAAGAISEKEALQAREDLTKEQAEYDRAHAALERLGVEPGAAGDRYLLRAPFAGTVVERKAVVGMDATPEANAPLVVVSDLSTLRVTVRLPERLLPLVHAGQPAVVRVDAWSQDFPAAVVKVGDVVDEATRTVPVRCRVPNADHRLKPAMFARVTLHAPTDVRLVAVPSTALLSDGETFRLIVRKPDGSLELRPVEVGAELGDRVQIVRGAQVGEEVVTKGALFAARELEGS
jgi:cobalt-zinc-cadmium efflux system membrane fusion protein